MSELVMAKKNNKTEQNPSLDLVASDIKLARAFVAVARSAHDLGDLDASEFARTKAMKFYCKAFRAICQMPNPAREPFSSDLQNLCTQIRWLSIERGAARDSCPEMNEDASMEALVRLLREGG
jgi:hypothetical protein